MAYTVKSAQYMLPSAPSKGHTTFHMEKPVVDHDFQIDKKINGQFSMWPHQNMERKQMFPTSEISS